MSLKGMRRELRKSGHRTETLVKEVEQEIMTWLRNGGVLLNPDDSVDDVTMAGSPIGTLGIVTEGPRAPSSPAVGILTLLRDSHRAPSTSAANQRCRRAVPRRAQGDGSRHRNRQLWCRRPCV